MDKRKQFGRLMIIIMKKRIYNIVKLVPVALIAFGCATGGFNQNPKLEDLNEEIAKAPSVVTIAVNGTVIERNTISIREVDAAIGDALNLSINLLSGSGAQLEELEFVQSFNGHDPVPADGSADGLVALSGVEMDYTHTYTVPTVDDTDADLHAGDLITFYFTVRNSNNFYGFKELEIHIVE